MSLANYFWQREWLANRQEVDSILIHFDVDVIDFDDFPVGDVPHYHGLSFDEAMSALKVFVASRKFGALVITKFNADRDPDGTLAVAKTLEERDS